MDENTNTNTQVTDTSAATNNEANKDGANKDNAAKTFTQEQLDEILKERISREKKNFETEKQKALEDALAEERKMAKLNAEEKEKVLSEKRAKELADRERDLNLKENKIEASQKFQELKIPTSLVDFVLHDDKAEMSKKIDTFSQAWTKALADEVAARTKGTAPADPASKSNGTQGTPEVVTVF